jgi:hypothetical protein
LAQNADLVVDPGCSSGGFDDVQDLHEQRVVMVRSLDGRNENNTAKECGVQSAKVRARGQIKVDAGQQESW